MFHELSDFVSPETERTGHSLWPLAGMKLHRSGALLVHQWQLQTASATQGVFIIWYHPIMMTHERDDCYHWMNIVQPGIFTQSTFPILIISNWYIYFIGHALFLFYLDGLGKIYFSSSSSFFLFYIILLLLLLFCFPIPLWAHFQLEATLNIP